MQVQPVTLEGALVRLVPMTLEHHAGLSAIGLDPALWERTTIQVRSPEEMLQYMQTALGAQAAGTALPFVITVRPHGEVVGSTRYHSIAPQHRRLEIGFTWIAVPWQRTRVNTESKYLLLRHAFEVLGCRRVEFKVDSENEPSCRALERIGATREATLRSYMHSPHKGRRDIALFSILDMEWPEIKAHLERRLDATSGERA